MEWGKGLVMVFIFLLSFIASLLNGHLIEHFGNCASVWVNKQSRQLIMWPMYSTSFSIYSSHALIPFQVVKVTGEDELKRVYKSHFHSLLYFSLKCLNTVQRSHWNVTGDKGLHIVLCFMAVQKGKWPLPRPFHCEMVPKVHLHGEKLWLSRVWMSKEKVQIGHGTVIHSNATQAL